MPVILMDNNTPHSSSIKFTENIYGHNRKYCFVSFYLCFWFLLNGICDARLRNIRYPEYTIPEEIQRHAHIYGLLGVRERVDLLIYRGPHGMADPLKERAREFFERWLK